jgi:hypothetical protein
MALPGLEKFGVEPMLTAHQGGAPFEFRSVFSFYSAPIAVDMDYLVRHQGHQAFCVACTLCRDAYDVPASPHLVIAESLGVARNMELDFIGRR